ncbi:MAG: hypothetical protein J1F28_00365 [Oscillospiraceae bacterium]|nr:hypothetical protein [Oscillospiraceae bacterium]
MRCPKRRRRKNGGKPAIILAAAAFVGAVLCISLFSFKVMLFIIALLLIVLGIFLLKHC